jgi:hypothetical protein
MKGGCGKIENCFVGAPSFKRPRRERLPVGRVAAAGIVLEYPLS